MMYFSIINWKKWWQLTVIEIVKIANVELMLTTLYKLWITNTILLILIKNSLGLMGYNLGMVCM